MPLRQDTIAAQVTAPLRTAFERTVSLTRWSTYLKASGYRQDLALRLNLWNAAVGQSFHFPLQTVEVALRNVSNAVLCDRFGADWARDQDCRAVLGSRRSAEIEKTITRLTNKYGPDPLTDQIVASLTLGFWAALLHSRYHGPVWAGYEADAFPNLGPHEELRAVGTVASDVQNLRNRIFHHEPLIGRDLSGDYGRIIKLLGWICAETRDWMRKYASDPVVIRMRPK
jgi:hypothetical protein